MKTTLIEIPEMTLEEFADRHGLEMVVKERPKTTGDSRYYACFKDCEISAGGFLKGEFGNGSNPGRAIRAYAKEISECCLVIDAMRSTRREIQACKLT